LGRVIVVFQESDNDRVNERIKRENGKENNGRCQIKPSFPIVLFTRIRSDAFFGHEKLFQREATRRHTVFFRRNGAGFAGGFSFLGDCHED